MYKRDSNLIQLLSFSSGLIFIICFSFIYSITCSILTKTGNLVWINGQNRNEQQINEKISGLKFRDEIVKSET